MKYIFVTGAAGYIGSAVCDMLLQKGFGVVATDSKPMRIINQNFRFVQSDITDKDTITAAMRDATSMIHLGCSVDNDFTPILSSDEDKMSAQVDKFLYKTAVSYKFDEVLMLSSYQVYQQPKNREPVREALDLKPITIYGKLKLDSEKALAAATKKSETKPVTMRILPVYSKSYLENLFAKVRDPKDGSIFLYGYGDYGYSFCNLHNLLDFILGIYTNRDNINFSGAYNICDTKPTSAKDIVEFLKQETNIPIVQQRNYSTDAVKNQFTLFVSKQIKTDYRYLDPAIACSNINYDNTKAQRFATFRWKLSNTK